ncbi:hypothetical protein ABZ914_47265 [Spirillospora sp. NPDC046719]
MATPLGENRTVPLPPFGSQAPVTVAVPTPPAARLPPPLAETPEAPITDHVTGPPTACTLMEQLLVVVVEILHPPTDRVPLVGLL